MFFVASTIVGDLSFFLTVIPAIAVVTVDIAVQNVNAPIL